jgi:hypothetical protein
VQRLGYLEFGELRRVAQRTLAQRQIFVNNLAIRRATEELKVATNYDQLCRVLVAAFSSNDFDSFELKCRHMPSQAPEIHGLRMLPSSGGLPCLGWSKPASYFRSEARGSWSLNLDLVTPNNRRYGSMVMHRLYAEPDLQLDINLLTSLFSSVLAEALDRTLGRSVTDIPTALDSSEVMAAQAG